jgi:hypothetical protein
MISRLLSLPLWIACTSCGSAQVDAAPPVTNTANTAFVLLPDATPPDAEAIAQAFPRFSTAEGQRLREQGTHHGGRTLEFGLEPGGTAFVALMPAAVPRGEADDAVRYSASALGTGWKLPAHNAHLLVTLLDHDTPSAIERLSRFTSVVAAVTEVSGAVGVYWGAAGATHDPKFVTSAAGGDDTSRMMLWAGVNIARDGKGRLSLLSQGMKQLNLPDLLLLAPESAGNAALGALFDFLVYAATRSQPLPEGDTIGRTADERLPVHYLPSPIDSNVKVWSVELN